jgi:hypothetical protein
MAVLSRAEDLNAQIEAKAMKARNLSQKILSKLEKFRENKFRPRIQGFDSDSEPDDDDNDQSGETRSNVNAQTKDSQLDVKDFR